MTIKKSQNKISPVSFPQFQFDLYHYCDECPVTVGLFTNFAVLFNPVNNL